MSSSHEVHHESIKIKVMYLFQNILLIGQVPKRMMIGSAETDIGTATYGLTPGGLDLLTRFHPLNERSLLEMEDMSNRKEEKETKEKPTHGKADETKMKGVGDAKTNVQGGRGSRGRARAKQDDCNEAFIKISTENLGRGFSGLGSLSSCGSTRNEASEDSFSAIAVNDLSLGMQGVELGAAAKVEPKKSRGRGRRIQKE